MFNVLHTVCFIHGLSIYTMFNVSIRYVLYMDCQYVYNAKCFAYGMFNTWPVNIYNVQCFAHGVFYTWTVKIECIKHTVC